MSEAETTEETPEPEPVVAPVPDEEEGAGEEEGEEPAAPKEPGEQPDEAPESEALMEEIGKKLDALTKTVATRISTILGEHANDFEVCDLCSYWNTPGWRKSGHLPDDLKAQMAYLIGQRAPSELEPDPHSRVCPTCKGEGFVATFSKVVGQEQLPCVECEGMGWLPTDDARRRGRLSLPNGPTAQALGVTAQDLAMQPAPTEEPPEAAQLRALGFVVVPPIAAGA